MKLIAEPVIPGGKVMCMSTTSEGRKATFFNTIFLPFAIISLFAQSYSNAFLMAFLVDNRQVVEQVRRTGLGSGPEIEKMLVDQKQFQNGTQGSVAISGAENNYRVQMRGDILASAFRLISILLLYFWLRPFFAFIRTRDDGCRAAASWRYNNFYRAIFSYFFVTHCIWFFTSTLQNCLPERLYAAIGYHLFWLVIECYLFYLFLEPVLFMYVSSLFAGHGQDSPGRSSLSIHMKLVTMIGFLVLMPMAIITSCLYHDYFLIDNYKYNVIILIFASAAFLVGNMQLLFKSIQEPLDVLGDKMQRLADGDFSVQTSVYFNDEIGRLKANFNIMVGQLKEREELKDTFGRYVSIEIARHLLENRKVSLGGERISATVLFSDIRNFTSMSEQMSPEEVVAMLNTYFGFVTEPIMENHGVINKFIGDAVMAVFTPHLGSENHVQDAINAALGMRKKLEELNASGKFRFPVRSGIGLNSGLLIAGNIGTEKRFEYTVIGDTVNVASRMETLSKTLEHDIILSQATVEQFPADTGLVIEKTEPVQIKGKSQPVPVYKLIGRAV